MCAMTRASRPVVREEDHVDRWIKKLESIEDFDFDPEVEGIVDRIGGISRRIKRAFEATLAEYDLNSGEWHVLFRLRLSSPEHRSSPGALAEDLEVSSGAMTNRLDRLAEAGLIRRLADPDDRRGVVIELTPEGRALWETTANIQARREAFFTSALTKTEQRQLNALLRKLMLAFEAREGDQDKKKK
jgi:DNA-binding MarR family transcriptional regulator